MNRAASSRIFLASIALAVAMLLSASPAAAANLRGRVDYQMPGLAYPLPMASALVELFPAGTSRPIASTRTGADGMYYFLNIPPGNYTLWINQRAGYSVAVGPILAQDIRPILAR